MTGSNPYGTLEYNQTYILFKHSDIEREHIHIVSVQEGRDVFTFRGSLFVRQVV